MDDQVTRIPPQKNRGGEWITFGDEAYRVPALGFRAVQDLQERIASMSSVNGIPSGQQMETVFDVVHAAMVRNYPAMTRDQVVDMIDVGNYRQLLAAVLRIAGFKEQERTEGEAQASTGTGSTSP